MNTNPSIKEYSMFINKIIKVFLSIAVIALMISCSSGGGGSDESTTTPEPTPATPPTVSAYSSVVDENSSIGTQVGVLTIDDGGSEITSVVLDGANSEDFHVAIDGTITVASLLDYETIPFYQLSVIASNSIGSSTPVDVNISVNDISEATLPVLTPFSGNVDENSIPETVIGQIGVNDGGSVVTAITLSGSGEGNFTVETDGTITIAEDAILDYEVQTLYALQAVARNGIGSSDPVNINISINNLYDQVLKTAQTISYDTNGSIVGDDSVKDDGFYQRGADRNSTRDANGIVTDNVTGLMWQDNTDASTVLKQWLSSDNYTTCLDNPTSPACFDTSGDTAATYCSDLTLGSYSDWRLPTRKELQSLSDYDGKDPAIDPVFQNTDILSFSWTSTSYAAISKNAWMVAFDGIKGKGGQYDDNKSVEGHVRCVRTGQ